MPGAKLQERLIKHWEKRTAPSQPPQNGEESDSGSEEGYRCCVTKSSGSKQDFQPEGAPLVHPDAEALRAHGNAHLQHNRFAEAAAAYSEALKLCGRHGSASAVLHSNRALAHLKLKQYTQVDSDPYPRHSRSSNPIFQLLQAAQDAEIAASLRPQWPKPHYRQAQACLHLRQYKQAVRSCRVAEALFDTQSNLTNDAAKLLDEIAVSAALAGSSTGFDGRHLEVRSAGKDAWLGLPAPEDPVLDVASADKMAFPLAPLPDAAASCMVLSTRREQLSFRSIKDALAAAKDGDQILLGAGIHNGMGEALEVRKRLLIQGDGRLGEARIDQRANSPTFRITRSCVVRNLDLDMTGFHEAIVVTGSVAIAPLIDGCIIRCSGDDAMNVADRARPTLRGCELRAAKCGLRAFGQSHASLVDCVIQDCGEQGVKLIYAARVDLQGCKVHSCKEDGLVVMDHARLRMQACHVHACLGPGIDVSDSSSCELVDSVLNDNVGGLWLWDTARANVSATSLHGGGSFVVLADGGGMPQFKRCVLEGRLHVTPAAMQGIENNHNEHRNAIGHVGFPPQDGAFLFEPAPFGRH